MKRLVIDTETTGLSPRFHKTLTVGMLLVDVEKDFLEILDSSHIFIKQESCRIDPRAQAVNGININEHNKMADDCKTACNKINDFVKVNSLNKTKLLGHNISFDKNFLTALFNEGKMYHQFSEESEDTMWIWRNLQKESKVPYSRSNLQTIANHFNIDYTKAHHALADCHITAKVYQRLLRFL